MAAFTTLRLFGMDIRARSNPDDQQITFKEHEEENKKNMNKKKTTLKRKFANIDDLPVPSLDGFPVLERIEKLLPVFLYRKWIEKSDVDGGLNRLFLSRSYPLINFMTAEERRSVMTGEGLDIPGFDSDGREYMFHCTKWKTQSQPCLTRESWKQLVMDNRVKAGQMIEIWGVDRWNGEKLMLIVSFRRAEESEEGESHGSSSGVMNASAYSLPSEAEDGIKGWGKKKARGSKDCRACHSF